MHIAHGQVHGIIYPPRLGSLSALLVSYELAGRGLKMNNCIHLAKQFHLPGQPFERPFTPSTFPRHLHHTRISQSCWCTQQLIMEPAAPLLRDCPSHLRFDPSPQTSGPGDLDQCDISPAVLVATQLPSLDL